MNPEFTIIDVDFTHTISHLVGSCQKPASIASQIFPLSQNLSWHLSMICSVSHKNFLSNSLTCLYSDSSVNFTSESSFSFETCSMSKLTLENPCLYFSVYVGSNLDWTAQTEGTHVADSEAVAKYISSYFGEISA